SARDRGRDAPLRRIWLWTSPGPRPLREVWALPARCALDWVWLLPGPWALAGIRTLPGPWALPVPCAGRLAFRRSALVVVIGAMSVSQKLTDWSVITYLIPSSVARCRLLVQ